MLIFVHHIAGMLHGLRGLVGGKFYASIIIAMIAHVSCQFGYANDLWQYLLGLVQRFFQWIYGMLPDPLKKGLDTILNVLADAWEKAKELLAGMGIDLSSVTQGVFAVVVFLVALRMLRIV